MPRMDSELKHFMLQALNGNEYENLRWVNSEFEIFELKLSRKPRGSHLSPEVSSGICESIFKAWDAQKGHEYEASRSKNRLLVSLRNSSYFKQKHACCFCVQYQFCSANEVAEKKKEKKKKLLQNVEQNPDVFLESEVSLKNDNNCTSKEMETEELPLPFDSFGIDTENINMELNGDVFWGNSFLTKTAFDEDAYTPMIDNYNQSNDSVFSWKLNFETFGELHGL